jgi:hypothetical protein
VLDQKTLNELTSALFAECSRMSMEIRLAIFALDFGIALRKATSEASNIEDLFGFREQTSQPFVA